MFLIILADLSLEVQEVNNTQIIKIITWHSSYDNHVNSSGYQIQIKITVVISDIWEVTVIYYTYNKIYTSIVSLFQLGTRLIKAS
jgi:hypothetical protein